MISQNLIEQLNLLPNYLGNHLLLTIIALSVGVIICIPMGVLVTRVKSLQGVTLSIVGILQTIPGIALLALMVTLFGKIGFVPALLALIIYSFLPILRNTVTGIKEVDASVVEAAIGVGMTDFQVLYKVELPLALPVIVAGIRTAAVWVIGTATLATPVGATSLGNYIFSGLQTQNLTSIVLGCISAALLAIVVDQVIYLGEKAAKKRSRSLGLIAFIGFVLLVFIGLTPMYSFKKNDSNDLSIIIGSKPFTEQYILAEYLSKNLQSVGFSTDLKPGMGSMILFQALVNNEVDCYIDYSGTIWTNVLKHSEIPNQKTILDKMTKSLLTNYSVTCLGGLGFENTYALVVKEDFAVTQKLKTIDDLQKISNKLSMGSDYEFFTRPEWKSLEEKYNLSFQKQVTLDPTLMYEAIGQHQVDVISAYSTDGRIIDYNLFVLEDPKQALPPYDAVILLSPNASKNKKLSAHLVKLVGKISDDLMRNANKIVDIDKQSIDSAVAFLNIKIKQ